MPTQARPIGQSQTPDGLWFRCNGCGEILYRKTLEANYFICTRCGYHFRIRPEKYIELLLDPGSFAETDADLAPADPLRFPDYARKAAEQAEKLGHNDAVICGRGRLAEIPVVLGAMDFAFLGGSMGSVVGEKLARIMRIARTERRPLIIIATSGGARMHEGVFSLMQMAKTAAELGLLRAARVPYISVPVDPCTGGVTASFAMLGDVIISEPGALIGFAGRRTIEGTIGEKLPEGFQTAEFSLRHGMLDMIVSRRDLRETIRKILMLLWSKPAAEGPKESS